MGSTGKTTQPTASTATPSVTPTVGLADDADSATIQAYYKNNFGIDVGGSYFRDNLDTKVLARTAQVLDTLVQELGKDTVEEMGIRIVSSQSRFSKSSTTYAQTSLQSGAIAVNPSLFKDYNTLKTAMHRDVASHFHPNGCKAADIIVHEFGHNLEFLINKRTNGNNRLNMFLADADQVYSKAIVKAAYAELKKEQPKLYSTEKQARASISRYADSKWRGAVAYTECLAEAVADYGRNGKNANPMSVKIWEGIKAALS